MRVCGSWAVIVLAVVLLVISAAGLSASAEVAAKVAQVEIRGNANVNAKTIAGAVTLKAGDAFSQEAANKDAAAIRALGFFQSVTAKTESVADGVKVIYEVKENPKITSVKITGSGPVAHSTIRGLMKVRAGQVLNSVTLSQDIDAIQKCYGDAGYIAYVMQDVGLKTGTGVLRVPILVMKVESIIVTGAEKDTAKALLGLMTLKPGDIFSVQMLKHDIIAIYNSNLVSDVKMYSMKTGAKPGLVRIEIPVVEK